MAETAVPAETGPALAPLLESVWDSFRESIRPSLPQFARTFLDDLDWLAVTDTVWPFLVSTVWPFLVSTAWPSLMATIRPFLRDSIWPFVASLATIIAVFSARRKLLIIRNTIRCSMANRVWLFFRGTVWSSIKNAAWCFPRNAVVNAMGLTALLMLFCILLQLAPEGCLACSWSHGRLIFGSPGGKRTPECKVPRRLVLREPGVLADFLVPACERAELVQRFGKGSEDPAVDWHALRLATQERDDAVVAHFYDIGRIQDELGDLLCHLKQFPTASPVPSWPPHQRSTAAKMLDVIACSPRSFRLGLVLSPAGTVADRADKLKGHAAIELERRTALIRILKAWLLMIQPEAGPADDGTKRDGAFRVAEAVTCRIEYKADGWRALAQRDMLRLEAEVRNIHRSAKPRMLSSLLWWRGAQTEKKARERRSAIAELGGKLRAANQGELLAQQCASSAAVSCRGANEAITATYRLVEQVEQEIDDLRTLIDDARAVGDQARLRGIVAAASEGEVRAWGKTLASSATAYLKYLRRTYIEDEEKT